TGTAQLDLTNNWMVVHNGNLAAIAMLTGSGANFNSGYWDGPGIMSSRAATNTITGIGFIDNNVFQYTSLVNDLGFIGTPDVALTSTDIVMRYTYFGDT